MTNEHELSSGLLPEAVRQRTLMDISIDGMMRNGQSRLKVPNVINQLPCGCERERGWEGQDDISWTFVKNERGIVHQQCAKLLRNIDAK